MSSPGDDNSAQDTPPNGVVKENEGISDGKIEIQINKTPSEAVNPILKVELSESTDTTDSQGNNQEISSSIKDDWTSRGDAILTGYLWKSSGREKNRAKHWQKRWFVLRSETLSYFKTLKDCKPLNEIPTNQMRKVTRCDDITRKENSLQIVTTNRTFYFYSTTIEECENWQIHLQALVPNSFTDIDIQLPFNDDSDESDGFFDLMSIESGESDPEKQLFGYLYKSGGKDKDRAGHWQKRWVILTESNLSYYRKQSDSKPAGIIPLLSITSICPNADAVTKKPYSFTISTIDRTFYFFASSEHHHDHWTDSIQNCLRSEQLDLISTSTVQDVQISLNLASPIITSVTIEAQEAPLGIERFNSIGEFQQTLLETDFDVPIDVSGFLWKTPGGKKKPGGWQKRWFVLKFHTLYYYRQQKDAKEAGCIDLKTVTKIDTYDKSNMFGLNLHTDDRLYYLYATSLQERDHWSTTIENSMYHK